MPAGDGTGPNGMGSMTGRAAGFCAGNDTPGYANPIGGRGYGCGFGRGRGSGYGRGFGRGRGRGFGRGYRAMNYTAGMPAWQSGAGQNAAAAPANELNVLKAHAESLNASLERITARIDELQNSSNE